MLLKKQMMKTQWDDELYKKLGVPALDCDSRVVKAVSTVKTRRSH